MSRTTSSGLPTVNPNDTAGPTPGPERAKRHFDTFETQFFKEGEESSLPGNGEVERFDDLGDLDDGKHRRLLPSRQLVIGGAAVAACLAVIGCVALWRSGNRGSAPVASDQASEKLPTPTPAPVPPTPEPAAAPAVAAAPAGAPLATGAPAAVPAGLPAAAPTVAAAPVPAAVPAPAPAAPAPAPAVVAPAVGAPAPAVAAPTAAVPASAAAVAAPAVAVPAPAAAQGSPAIAVQAPAAPVKAPSPAPAVALPDSPAPGAPAEKPAAPVAVDSVAALARCKEIASSRRQKDLIAVCSGAYAEAPSADVAVILAKAEFDKGRSAQALAWGQKALAADPNAVDAYVFIGGAEQNAGHNKAAKEAYKHYLQLAPGGRYAADLRAIVSSL